MKYLFSSYILAALSAATMLVSCSKKEEIAHQNNNQLIIQNSWKFRSATVGGIDIAPALQNCQKDNIVSFEANGSGTLEEGDTRCNVSDPQSNPFTWNFTGNESTLHVSTILFTGGSNDFTLINLSGSQLVVSQNVTVSGSSQTAVVTFAH